MDLDEVAYRVMVMTKYAVAYQKDIDQLDSWSAGVNDATINKL